MRATCESSLTPTSQLDRFLWRGGVAQLAEQRTHKPTRHEGPLVIFNGYKGFFLVSLVPGGVRSCRVARGHSYGHIEKVSWFARQLRLHLPALDRLNCEIVGNFLDAMYLSN